MLSKINVLKQNLFINRRAFSSWNINKMAKLLDNNNYETRDKLKELFKDEIFTPKI